MPNVETGIFFPMLLDLGRRQGFLVLSECF